MSFSARRFVVKAIPHRLFPLSVLALLCAAPAVAEDSQNLEHIEVRHHQSYRGQVPVENCHRQCQYLDKMILLTGR